MAVDGSGVAQVSERGVRVLPDLTWERLEISREAVRLRERIVDAIRDKRLRTVVGEAVPVTKRGGAQPMPPALRASPSPAHAPVTAEQWAGALKTSLYES